MESGANLEWLPKASKKDQRRQNSLTGKEKRLSPEKESTIKEKQSTTTDEVSNGTLAAGNEEGTAGDDRDGTEGNVTASVSPDKGSGEGTTGIPGTGGTGINGGIRDGKVPDGTAGQKIESVTNEAGPGNRDADKDDLGSSPGGQPDIPGKPLHAGHFRILAGGYFKPWRGYLVDYQKPAWAP
jgi:hypothetical protein